MPVTRNFKQAFSGGEISPEMFGRIADNKFQQGAATMRNFIAKPQGPAQNRSGFAFVKEVKDSTKSTRLLSFTFNTTQTTQSMKKQLWTQFSQETSFMMFLDANNKVSPLQTLVNVVKNIVNLKAAPIGNPQ